MGVNQAPERASSYSAAVVLASELRQARAEALRQNAPVALAFPSQGGALPSSVGFYWLQGKQKALMTRQVDLTRQSERINIFSGFWDLDTTALLDPASANSNAPPHQASREDAFDPAHWPQPNPADPALIFTPSGAASSNGMVHFDGAYHLVVCAGVEASPSTFSGIQPASLTYYKAVSVDDPYTVTISLQGDIQVTRGLVGASGVALRGGSNQRAPLPVASSSSNSDPTVDPTEVEVLPVTPAASLPPGVAALVPLDRFLTIKVAATDPDGDPLSIRWRASGGNFSGPALATMEWSPQRQRWEASVAWRPPSTATVGQLYELNCDISDGRGGTVTVGGNVVSALKVKTSPTGKLVVSYRYSSVLNVFCPDGSGMRQINLPDTVCSVSGTPDGEKVVFSHWGGGPYQGVISAITVDGTNYRQLANLTAGCIAVCEPDVAPSGRLAMMEEYGLRTANGDGTNFQTVTTNYYDLYPRWSPDESKLVYNSYADEVIMIDPDGSNPQNLGPGFGPMWSPDGNRLLFRRSDGVYIMNRDGSGITQISTDCCGVAGSVAWSPDGSQVAWLNGGDVVVAQADGSNTKVVATFPQADTLLWLR